MTSAIYRYLSPPTAIFAICRLTNPYRKVEYYGIVFWDRVARKSESCKAWMEMTMRIVEDTPTYLKMRDRTLWISIVCFCAAAIGIGYVALGRELSQLIPAAVAVAFGLAFFRATDVTFDKVQRTCAIRRFDVVRIMRTRLAFDDITDIKVEARPSGNDSGSISSRLSVVTASATIPLTASYRPGLDRHNSMRDALLDVLFADDARPPATDPVHDLVEAGRIIDAVAILRTRERLDLTTARIRVEQLRNAAST